MKNSLRFITLILAAVFLIAGTAMIAYADAGLDDGGEIVGDDGGDIIDPGIDPGVDPGVDVGDIGDYDSGDAGNVDTGDSGNVDTGDSGNVDTGDSGNVDTGDSGNVDTGDAGNVDTGNAGNVDTGNAGDSDIGSYDPGNVDTGSDDSGSGNADAGDADTGSDDSGYSDDSNQVYYDPDPIYYGDASNYDYNTSTDNNRDAGSVDTDLYDATVNTSDAIKAQKWEDIEIPDTGNNVKLNSGNANGDVSFASMKANDGSGDDMGYIPYVGMALVALAVLGILYFIVATVSQRKAMKGLKNQPTKAYAGGFDETNIGSAEDFKKENLSKTRTRGRNHYADDYEDGYSATRKGAKADTGEINLPRRFK